MNDIIHVVRSGKLEVLGDLSSIKKGERYRVCTASFEGPWRTAASDATPRNNGWQVRPTTSNVEKTNGYNG